MYWSGCFSLSQGGGLPLFNVESTMPMPLFGSCLQQSCLILPTCCCQVHISCFHAYFEPLCLTLSCPLAAYKTRYGAEALFARKQRNADGSESGEFFSNEEFIAMLDLLVYSSLSALIANLQKHHAWYIMRIASIPTFRRAPFAPLREGVRSSS